METKVPHWTWESQTNFQNFPLWFYVAPLAGKHWGEKLWPCEVKRSRQYIFIPKEHQLAWVYPISPWVPRQASSLSSASIASLSKSPSLWLCLSKFLPLFIVGLRSSYISSMFLGHPIMFFPLTPYILSWVLSLFLSPKQDRSTPRPKILSCPSFFSTYHLAHSWMLRRNCTFILLSAGHLLFSCVLHVQ